MADPGPTPFLLPWATARREAGRPISSPPFLCQDCYSKGKFQIYTCATENAAHIQGAKFPWAHKLLWRWAPPSPALLLGSHGFCIPPCLQRKAGEQKPSYGVDSYLKRQCGNGRFRNLVSSGGKKKLKRTPSFPVRNKIKVSDQCW